MPGDQTLLQAAYFEAVVCKIIQLLNIFLGDIQPGANKGGFTTLTTFISFSSLKSQTQPQLGASPSIDVPQRAHDGGTGAEGGRVRRRWRFGAHQKH